MSCDDLDDDYDNAIFFGSRMHSKDTPTNCKSRHCQETSEPQAMITTRLSMIYLPQQTANDRLMMTWLVCRVDPRPPPET